LISQPGSYLCRQRPTLPRTFACSTIGPAGLNLRRFAGVSEAGARSRHPERSGQGGSFDVTLKIQTRDSERVPLTHPRRRTRSARGSTRLRCAVHLCTMLGIRCAGRNRTDWYCPRTTRTALPRRRVVLASRCGNYLLVPSLGTIPTTLSSSLLPGFSCLVRDTVSRDHLLSAESPRHSRY
jgi:hypothetical protein